MVDGGAALSDYRVEQQYRLSYPKQIKPECQAHGENSSLEDQGQDKSVVQLNHYLVTEFNRRQNSVSHM